jgi:hypothetical protein
MPRSKSADSNEPTRLTLQINPIMTLLDFKLTHYHWVGPQENEVG